MKIEKWANIVTFVAGLSFSIIMFIFYLFIDNGSLLIEPNIFILMIEYIIYIVSVPICLFLISYNYYKTRSIELLILNIVTLACCVGGLGLFYNIYTFGYYYIPHTTIYNILDKTQKTIVYGIFSAVNIYGFVKIVNDSYY
jgi:hypothetical protein